MVYLPAGTFLPPTTMSVLVNEGCRLICAGAPDFAVRNQFSENLAAFHAGAGIISLDSFASTQVAGGGLGWAGLASTHLGKTGSG